MKHKLFASVALLGMMGLAGCIDYPSEDINNGDYNTVMAAPVYATVKKGDSVQVLLRLVNDANNGATTSYNISDVGSGIAVHYQANWRPINSAETDSLVPRGDKTMQNYYVVGLTPGRYTFKATPTTVNTGVSTVVTILVTPLDLGAALSTNTAAAGDQITLTAPTGTAFTDSSAISFTTGTGVIVSQDGGTLIFTAGPGISGPVKVTNVQQTGAPTIIPLTLTSTDSLTTPEVTVAAATLSTSTPAINAPVTVTLGGSMRFTESSVVSIGGVAAAIQSISDDSTSATILPIGISSGDVTFENIAFTFLPSATFDVPSNGQSLTVQTPTITLPGTGNNIVVAGGNDYVADDVCGALGDGCIYYKVTSVAGGSFDVSLTWTGTADLGLYAVDQTGSRISAITADDHGGQNGGPETATITVPAGTSYFAIVVFGAAPSDFSLSITGN